jgi:signal transduction histidine kinase
MTAFDDDRPHPTAARLPEPAEYQPSLPGRPGLLADPIAGAISGASHRLRALAALSGSLTDALTPEEAADLVEQKALSALGATSAVVVTLGAFPSRPSANVVIPAGAILNVVHAIGLPAEIGAALDKLPLDAPVPLAEVARDGVPRFLPSELALASYPEWGAAMIAAGAQAAAIVPVWANGELRGVLGLAWADPRVFDEDERAFVLTLGVMCAQAIMRAHLRAAEREAREAAEQANRSKARFVATISHELRTPMNAVLGYTQLVAEGVDGPISAIQKAHLGRVHASGQHLLGLVEDLLGFARVEAGEEVVQAEPVLLDDIVDQSLELVVPLAELKGLHLRVERTERPVELHIDLRKVRQILVNVLANAVKFSDEGEIVLRLRIAGSGATARVGFEVTDSGRGIAPEEHERIFEPFWRSDPSTRYGASSGLGLSVARQLARLLRGDLMLAGSELGEGSTFIVDLPAHYPG